MYIYIFIKCDTQHISIQRDEKSGGNIYVKKKTHSKK